MVCIRPFIGLMKGAYNDLDQPTGANYQPIALTAVPACVEASTTSLTAPSPTVVQTGSSGASPVSFSFTGVSATSGILC